MKSSRLTRFFASMCFFVLVTAVFPAFAFGDEKAEDVPLTRAELVSLIIAEIEPEMQGGWMVQQFDDIPEDAPYYEDLLKAKALGIVSGTGNNLFRPDALVTREQMLTMVYNSLDAAGLLPPFTTLQWIVFADWDDVSEYAQEPVQALGRLRLIGGDDGELKPKETVTYGEARELIDAAFDEGGLHF